MNHHAKRHSWLFSWHHGQHCLPEFLQHDNFPKQRNFYQSRYGQSLKMQPFSILSVKKPPDIASRDCLFESNAGSLTTQIDRLSFPLLILNTRLLLDKVYILYMVKNDIFSKWEKFTMIKLIKNSFGDVRKAGFGGLQLAPSLIAKWSLMSVLMTCVLMLNFVCF